MLYCSSFKGDTIWIECTAPDLALGYVHSDIAGHDALVMTDDGGKIMQVARIC